MLGTPGAAGAVVSLLIVASLGLGLLISIVSDSERQAVQLSLLVLLASVFFSGFVLPISEFSTPVRVAAQPHPGDERDRPDAGRHAPRRDRRSSGRRCSWRRSGSCSCSRAGCSSGGACRAPDRAVGLGSGAPTDRRATRSTRHATATAAAVRAPGAAPVARTVGPCTRTPGRRSPPHRPSIAWTERVPRARRTGVSRPRDAASERARRGSDRDPERRRPTSPPSRRRSATRVGRRWRRWATARGRRRAAHAADEP